SEATRVLSSARDRILVLAQAGNVARNGALGHFSRLIHRPPVGYATRQRRDERGVAALRLGPEHDVVVVARLGHGAILSCCGRPVKLTRPMAGAPGVSHSSFTAFATAGYDER